MRKGGTGGKETGLNHRTPARMDFAPKLSKGPYEAGKADVERLIENGFSMGEVLDLVLTASLFGWANRLMHVLGDPLPQDEAGQVYGS